MTEQERARRSAEAMWATDQASPGLGMVLEDIGPGMARMAMVVEPRMLNGHGICHGGFIFALADSAFAFACNTHNRLAVAQTNQITYLDPGQQGERLTAEAQEISLTGRTGITDVRITGGDGRLVALFRGQSRQIAGSHFEEDS